MKKSSLIIPASILLAVLLTGCAQNTPSNPPVLTQQVASTDNTQQEKSKDLCVLLSAEDVSATLGYSVMATHDNVPSSPIISDCNYQSTNPANSNVTIIATYGNETLTAKAGYESSVDYQKQSIDPSIAKVEDVSGVGDQASLTTTASMGNLMTLKGNVWITASMSGSDATARDEMLKTLTQKALDVL